MSSGGVYANPYVKSGEKITYADVISILPFNNTVQTVTLSPSSSKANGSADASLIEQSLFVEWFKGRSPLNPNCAKTVVVSPLPITITAGKDNTIYESSSSVIKTLTTTAFYYCAT